MKNLILLLLGIWTGLVLGISFIEAPLKFQAPGITIPLGLGIGQLVFGFSNKVQLVFLSLLLGFTYFRFGTLTTSSRFYIGTITGILIIQSLILLPLLDARATQIIAGNTIPDSPLHIYFVILEVIKI